MIERTQSAGPAAQLTPLKQALLALRDMRNRLEALEHARGEPIAMIGMGCRLPGDVNDPQSFWRLLRNGVDAITDMPRDRWDVDAYYDPDPEAPGKMSTRWGGFVKGIDQFDAAFFGISPTEARSMDPQQRFLLEVAQEAFDDAGLPRERLAGSRTGVFVGLAHSEYAWLNLSNVGLADAYSATGSFGAIGANRVSYVYDLRGPSYTVDAVCSSSLLAVHLACESLRNRECNVALAAGAGLFLRPEGFVWFTKLGVMSPQGRCRAFDAHGNGIVLSEGVAAVVLKPLSTALADGDPIYAVIRGSGVVQDGRSNGLTAPSREAQEAMLWQAYQRAGVDPREVQYVETHGTGTVLGDPIEAHALGTVLGRDRPADQPCYLGSVKTNLGHMQTVGGLVGAMKVALSMRHGQLPPSLHFTTANAHIPFADLRLRVQDGLGPWPYGERMRAGVTSLSFGGTNVHLVMEEAPPNTPVAALADSDRAFVLPVSAHTPTALTQVVEGYQQLVQDNHDEDGSPLCLEDLCYTASTRRSHYDRRLAVAFRSRNELLERLSAFLRHEARPGIVSGTAPRSRRKLAFVFSGQGGQWHGMARQLLDSEPVFRASLELTDAAFGRYANWSILDELTAPGDRSRLDRIDVVQPTTFAIQVGLAALWEAWGVAPDAVVGHSMGEVAAACVAGALGIDAAVRLIYERSRLLARLRGQGAMAVVELGLDDARACLAQYADSLAVAASNSPTSSVLSGDPAALQQVLAALNERGVFCRKIEVDVAAHSPYVAALSSELRDGLRDLQPQSAKVPIYSTVSGDRIDGKALNAAYWARNLGEPVLFSNTTLRLLEAGYQTFVEIGPHPTLLSAVERTAEGAGKQVLTVACLKRGEDEQMVLRTALGNLYTQGYPIAWSHLYPSAGRRIVRLPRYAWQHRRFWLDQSSGRWPSTGLQTNADTIEPEAVDEAVEECVGAESARSKRASVGATTLDRTQLLALGSPAIRRAALTAYLRARIAESLGLSSRELDIDLPLTALGLNSLMIFELQSRLKAAFGGGISVDDFTAGISVDQVATQILQQVETSQPPQFRPASIHVGTTAGITTPVCSLQPEDWLLRPEPRPDAKLRLFCLAYAGGAASIYREWSKALPPDIEVCAIQLPGREQRFHETPFRQLTALVQTLTKIMEPEIERPYAIFGHSMGGLLGFELARQARRQKLPEPVHLFVSASRAPHLLEYDPPLHRLPELQLLAKLRELNGTPEEMLADPEIMRVYLPLLRADFAVVETYVYRAEDRLSCPITAFGGELDRKIGTPALDAWEAQTRASFTRQLLPGDHFFLHSAREALLASVAQQLARAYGEPRPGGARDAGVIVSPGSPTRGDRRLRDG